MHLGWIFEEIKQNDSRGKKWEVGGGNKISKEFVATISIVGGCTWIKEEFGFD
jgi:hypothetical protein